MEATALYDFDATADDELSFRKGDILKLLGTSDDWYKAELNGREGMIPKNFINCDLPRWYQENASRGEAQDSLMSKQVGAFLIRGSQSFPGDFSISVRHEADVQHFKVLRNKAGQFHLWSERFPSLNQLVEYYKKNSVSRQSSIILLETGQQETGNRGSSRSLPISSNSPDPVLQSKRPSATKMQVKALYSFRAENRDELDFNSGDIIEVIDNSNPSWWKGKLCGRTGLFPSNYTAPA